MRKSVLLWGVVAAAVAVLAAALYRGAARRTDREINPYAYDLSPFRAVPAALAAYTEAQRIAIDGADPRAVATGGDDRIYVGVDRAVHIFTRAGEPAGRIELEAVPHCLHVAADGRLFVGLRDHVEVFAPNGKRDAVWTSLGEEAVVTAVATLADDVFVADAGNRLVWRFDASGRLRGHIGTDEDNEDAHHFIVPSPYFDLAAGPDGLLWVVNPGRQRLEQYDAEGALRAYWGKAAMTIDGFAGCCNPCHLALGPDGRFYTSEKGLLRVKVYEPDGRLAAVVAAPDQFADETPALDIAVDSGGRVLVLDPTAVAVRIFARASGTGKPEG